MSRQLATLHLRGSLINKTMKNLTTLQLKMIENKLEEQLDNKDLIRCRAAFLKALANTIKNDYV